MSLETLSTISPTTNSAVVTRQALSPEEIALLPAVGQEAFTAYRKSHPNLGSRQEIIAIALKLLSERKDVLAKELTEQMGRPIAYTGIEIDTAVKRGQYLNKIAGEVLGEDVPGDAEKGFKRSIRREPVGVVLIIFAWNVSASAVLVILQRRADSRCSIPT
jgi:acyl-CoA reductase-like NAD-dependent aldehyde dehydrogenase